MDINSVTNRTLIIRSQAEYSTSAQTMIVRYILETPGSAKRRGFAGVESLLAALEAELTELQNQIIP